jgi:UDP-N-acetylglucosamine 2-epimerase (non-hydrolysing)
MQRIIFLFGTRPEAIKMAPLIKRFQRDTSNFQTIVAVTGQHREMLDQVLVFFDIVPDYDLNLMMPGQSLSQLTSRLAASLDELLLKSKPDIVFVQGDTTTAMMGALISFYHQIKVIHIEAGLRSYNIDSPFPEEANRKIVGNVAFAHMVPTEGARINLKNEGYTKQIHVTGNTVVDALFLGLDIIDKSKGRINLNRFGALDFKRSFILVTGHRRESFGESFESICQSIKELKLKYPEFQFIYPVHLNPKVTEPVSRILGEVEGVHLIEPLDYPHLLYLLQRCYLVLTDSGGIQEEAPSLGKPVLVMRDVTERMEGVLAGTARLVGTDRKIIIEAVSSLIEDKEAYEKMAKANNPYGDGNASEKIYKIIREIT